jgi:EpsI family protein
MALHVTTFRNLLAVGEVESEISHRVFALPVFLVLLWQARTALRWPQATPSGAGVALLVLLGLSWAAGELTYIRALSEVAVIALIPAAVLAMFGWTWFFVLLFPMCFLLFAVPLRGPLVDWQVALTADFVHAALRFSGVPVHRDGAFFELPGRSWSVADECSGVEYLSACLMFAALFAWTMYASNRKRAWFVLGAVVLGLAGNWLRAYLTIALAHFSGNRLFAEGHGTFGWIFFACLLFLYCWVGWRYRDSIEDSSVPAVDEPSNRGTGAGKVMIALALAALIGWPLAMAAWPAPAGVEAHPISAPEIPGAWTVQDATACPWQPRLKNPVWTRDYCYKDANSSPPVHLAIGGFARQSWNTKLVTSVHELAPQGWSMVQRDQYASALGKFHVEGRAFVVRKGGERFRVWQWYALHNEVTGSDLTAKWHQLKARLTGKPEQSFWIAVAVRTDQGVDRADEALRTFVAALGEPLARSLFP